MVIKNVRITVEDVMRELEKLNLVGGTLLVHTKDGAIPKIIQKVQSRRDPVSGKWNHSAKIYLSYLKRLKAYEATEMPNRKFRGVVRPTPLEDYVERELRGEVELLFLVPKECMMLRDEQNMQAFEDALLKYVGTPYDVWNLILHQPWYYIVNVWLGRKEAKAKRSQVCHEYSMTVDNTYIDTVANVSASHKHLMPERAQVFSIYYNNMYDKIYLSTIINKIVSEL